MVRHEVAHPVVEHAGQGHTTDVKLMTWFYIPFLILVLAHVFIGKSHAQSSWGHSWQGRWHAVQGRYHAYDCMRDWSMSAYSPPPLVLQKMSYLMRTMTHGARQISRIWPHTWLEYVCILASSTEEGAQGVHMVLGNLSKTQSEYLRSWGCLEVTLTSRHMRHAKKKCNNRYLIFIFI